MEEDLRLIYEGNGGGLLSQDYKDTLVHLEKSRNSLLMDKEESWRLKSRATWLACGEDNTKNFHAYARGRKAANTIWSLRDGQGI